MIERRYRPGVAVLGGKIYVLGGEEGWDHYHDTIGKNVSTFVHIYVSRRLHSVERCKFTLNFKKYFVKTLYSTKSFDFT